MAVNAGGKLAVGPAEAAVLISVPERTVWAEISAGRLKSFKLGKRRLIRVAELDAFVERRELLANAPTSRRARPVDRTTATGAIVPFPELEPAQRGATR